MENKRNSLHFIQFIVLAFLCGVICGAEENSGDFQDLSPLLKNVPLVVGLSSIGVSEMTTSVGANETTTSVGVNKTTTSVGASEMTTSIGASETTSVDMKNKTLVTKLTPTNQPIVTKSTYNSVTDEPGIMTLVPVSDYKTTDRYPKNEKHSDQTELQIELSGYKIATFCLAGFLGVLFLIILIYILTKSRTGRGDITCPPGTPPEHVESYPRNEQPKIVRLSSYFPYAEKVDMENGDVDVDDERKVTTFLTRKKSLEDATGSQDKILHTSEL